MSYDFRSHAPTTELLGVNRLYDQIPHLVNYILFYFSCSTMLYRVDMDLPLTLQSFAFLKDNKKAKANFFKNSFFVCLNLRNRVVTQKQIFPKILKK